MMAIEIAEVLTSDKIEDWVTEDELLKLYHNTTVHIDDLTIDGRNNPHSSDLNTLTKDPQLTKSGLDRILSQVQGVWGDSDNLRLKVHNRVDAIFNANGYGTQE